MDRHEITDHEEAKTYDIARNRFIVFIAGVIVISLVIVCISLGLYAASGAAQLDLSRPDYKSIRDQVSDGPDYSQSFPSSGAIDQEAVDTFRTLYKDAAHQADAVPVFSDSSLSDEDLGIAAQSSTK